MTTDIHAVSALDLSIDNKVMNLDHMRLPEGNVLAGACWFVVDSSAHEALLSVLRFVYGLIVKKFPHYKVWLLVGNSAWQPDTRIVRYRKLWNALGASGIKISHSCNTQEIMREEDGKLKFFGATQLSELSVESVVRVLLEEHCTYLAALPSTTDLESILNIGWSGYLKEDSKIITTLIENEGLLIKRVGEFDDSEKGVVAIGRPELIKLLLG